MKKYIYPTLWILCLLLICWWLWKYFHKEEPESNTKIETKQEDEEKTTTEEKDKDEEETTTEKNPENLFAWLPYDEEDNLLIPLAEGEIGTYVEKPDYHVEDVEKYDYKLEEGEEIIMANLKTKTKVQGNEKDKDEAYLEDIINSINKNKRRWSKDSITTNTSKWVTNQQKDNQKTSTFLSNFIWALETKKTNNWYLYQYTFTDPSFWTTPVRISFFSTTSITNDDIKEDIWWDGINIPKLKFHWEISNAEVTKDFWITRCWLFEPEGYVFRPGMNTFSLKGNSEEGFIYINHLSFPIYPVFVFPWDELSRGNKNCLVEIGTKENFNRFPFQLKGSFENAVVSITKNKDANSNCSTLLWNHDNNLVIYNEEIACEIRYNNWTTLKEITTR